MSNFNTIEVYSKFAKYYDTYVKDFKDDLDFYFSFCEKDAKILEVGCGTGRILKYLLEKDLTNITGIDISEEMLNLAKEKLNKYLIPKILTLKNHNFETGFFKNGFDTVFVSFYTFNYILKNPIKFLKNIYLSMKNDSSIVLDLFYPKTLANPEIEGKWIEREFTLCNGNSVKLKDKRSFDGSFEKRIQIFTEDNNKTEIETNRRFFDKKEIKNLLTNSGFQNVEFTENYLPKDLHKLNTREETSRNFQVRAAKKT